MAKRSRSIGLILAAIYVFNIAIPLFFISYAIPTIYKNRMIEEQDVLIENNLDSLSRSISEYLLDLQKLATIPYYDADIMQALQERVTGSSSGDEPATLQDIDLILPNYIRISREDILSTIILSSDGTILFSNRNKNIDLVEGYDFTVQPWFQSIIEAEGNVIFTGAHIPDYFTFSETLQVFSVARVIKHPYIEGSLGVVIADAETTAIQELFSKLESTQFYNLVLFDQDQQVIYASHDLGGEMLSALRQGEPLFKVDGNTYTAYTRTVIPSRWKVVMLATNEGLRDRVWSIYLVGILSAVVSLLVTGVVFSFVIRVNIVNPIKDMLDIMRRVERGDLTGKFHTKTRNEISYLGENLNIMIDRLNEHIEQEYRLVIEQKRAEYEALQAQIQPHFLYNTLNGFIGLSRLGRNEILEKSIADLNAMLRYTLASDTMTMVAKEFQFIESYCALQKLRFSDRMHYTITLGAACEEFQIPRLLLQPLVENSIIHGLEPIIRPVTIQVTGMVEGAGPGACLVLSVCDDGKGMMTQGAEGIGISSTRKRLLMTFPGSGMTIASEPGAGTSIVLRIPIQNRSGDDIPSVQPQEAER